VSKYVSLYWHPWRCNPLDYIDARLMTPNGDEVQLTREGLHFVVRMGGQEIIRTIDNAATCAVLDSIEAGLAIG